MIDRPFKLLASIFLHIDKEFEYENVRWYVETPSHFPESKTKAMLINMYIRRLILMDQHFDMNVISNPIYDKEMFPVCIFACIESMLISKKYSKNYRVKGHIFGKKIDDSLLSDKISMMLEDSDSILPYADGLEKEYRKYLKFMDYKETQKQLVVSFLKKFAHFTQVDAEYIIGVIEKGIDLKSMFNSNSFVENCPSYRLDSFKKAINRDGVIIDGLCSLCWARKNGADIYKCKSCKEI